MRRLFATLFVAIFGSCYISMALAEGDCGDGFTTVQLMRDDLAGLKKKVEIALSAVPKPKSPYAKANESWSLPSYACKDKSGQRPLDLSYNSTWNTDASMQKMGMDYQKQIMAAEAAGNYQEVMKITQKMQARAMAQASANQGMPPLEINLSVNTGDANTIDPDSVIRDGRGFIAIRTNKDRISGNENISIFFDPVALKDAHQLASFDLSGDYRVPAKLSLLSLRIDMSGPSNILEPIVKEIDVGSVLGTLTTERKKLNAS